MSETTAEVDFATVVAKSRYLSGSSSRSRCVTEKGTICRTLEERVEPLFASRRVWPAIDRIFPFRDAAAAHRLMETSALIGQILHTP